METKKKCILVKCVCGSGKHNFMWKEETYLNLFVFFNWVKEVKYHQSSLILKLLDYS